MKTRITCMHSLAGFPDPNPDYWTIDKELLEVLITYLFSEFQGYAYRVAYRVRLHLVPSSGGVSSTFSYEILAPRS